MKTIIPLFLFLVAGCGGVSKISGEMQINSDSVDAPISGEEGIKLWLDTVMYAKGHAFGYSGDLSMWGGWYLDTVCVGNDLMLRYDSIGPSSLKLSLITRDIIVDMGDSDVINKIRSFLNPIDGFKRFSKRYEECLDTLYYEGYGFDEYMGGFTFEVDYPDTCIDNAGIRINRFIYELAGLPESGKGNVPELSDFLAHRRFEKWKREGNFGMGSSEATLAIRPHLLNKRYVTLSKYEYNREGIGHGMYTEGFHTFDIMSGKKLKNKDIFKAQSLDQVKMKLFEVMANDPRYLKWHGESVEASEIESMIEAWRSITPDLEDTESEETKREFKFELPEGALTESGIIFSFQPYEIDCWAAGAYHFVVPYNKIMPYLTEKAKKLIN